MELALEGKLVVVDVVKEDEVDDENGDEMYEEDEEANAKGEE